MFGQGFSLRLEGSIREREGGREGGREANPGGSGCLPGVNEGELEEFLWLGQPAGHKGWAGALDNTRSVPS